MRGLGTILNIAAVGAGTVVGVLVGGRLPDRFRTTVLQGLGLFTVFVGLREAFETRNALMVLGALLLGGLLGELVRIEDRLASAGAAIERRVDASSSVEPDAPERVAFDEPLPAGERTRFVEGFVVASLVFCVGPLTILGSIQDGLDGDIDLLATKSLLDGFASLAFASTLGWGVGASIVTIAVLQGSLTAFAALLDDVLTTRMVDEMSAVGGLMLVGIGLRLLDLAEVRVASFLPGLVVAPVLVALFGT
ncbi:MAG TPA: DUF554 domain-containing protein [Acidimicrobiia bacterium]|nr:DUF554 domain-containing protein [Acidimicrobiia bacterium]